MDIAPKVDAPRKGDPITADWAARVASAANAAPETPQKVGAFATPFGSASPAPGLPMLGEQARWLPFDCILTYDAQTDAYSVYCYVPRYSSGTEDHPPFVVVYGSQALTTPGSVGTSTNPWVKVCDVASNKRTWVYLYLTNQSDPENGYYWALGSRTAASTTGYLPNPPSDAWEFSPVIPIAWAKPGDANGGARGGIVQLWHGIVNIGTGALVPWGLAENVVNGIVSPGARPGGYIYLAQTGITIGPALLVSGGLRVDDGASGGNIDAVGYVAALEFHVGSEVYKPQNIVDGNGNTVKVLAKQ